MVVYSVSIPLWTVRMNQQNLEKIKTIKEWKCSKKIKWQDTPLFDGRFASLDLIFFDLLCSLRLVRSLCRSFGSFVTLSLLHSLPAGGPVRPEPNRMEGSVTSRQTVRDGDEPGDGHSRSEIKRRREKGRRMTVPAPSVSPSVFRSFTSFTPSLPPAARRAPSGGGGGG